MTCGICEKDGGSLYWHGTTNGQVHQSCYTKIDPFETEITLKIHLLFPKEYWDEAHGEAIKAVRAKCGGCSISKYLKEKGRDSLTNLFNTVGIDAVNQYAQSHSF